MLVENASNNVMPNKSYQKNGSLQQQDFLNMLVTQLRYQDPMDPESGGDMTQQMSMFNMMDQGAQTNEYLAKLLELQQLDNQRPKMQDMVNYIDKAVEIDTSKITLAEGQAKCNFTLAEATKALQVVITDEHGDTIYSKKLSDVSAGPQQFIWDGLDRQGHERRSGQYRLSLIAHDQMGREMKVMPKISGIVDNVSKVHDAPYLQVGELLIDPQQVITIKKNI